jgi:serine/threonine-protein phosphatase PGAM5
VTTRTLLLLRHGQYEPDDGGRLTELGREQARTSARFLADTRLDAIWASTLPRAKETAQIVAEHLARAGYRGSVRTTSILKEGMYTKVDGYEVPAAERQRDRARADKAYAKFFRKSRSERTELIVCHGNLIRYLVCRALRTPIAKWTRMVTAHCGLTRIVIRDSGAVRVVSYNETAHLPPKLVT